VSPRSAGCCKGEGKRGEKRRKKRRGEEKRSREELEEGGLMEITRRVEGR
jgi:hypothetical protein